MPNIKRPNETKIEFKMSKHKKIKKVQIDNVDVKFSKRIPGIFDILLIHDLRYSKTCIKHNLAI